jgi:hypothetical protein
MLTSRRLQVVALCCAIALWTAAGPSLALPLNEPGAAPEFHLAQLGGRKGTRNYIPDTYSDQVLQDTTPAGSEKETETKALDDCIATWDAGTHITKSKWREICKRQIKERGAQLSGR